MGVYYPVPLPHFRRYDDLPRRSARRMTPWRDPEVHITPQEIFNTVFIVGEALLLIWLVIVLAYHP